MMIRKLSTLIYKDTLLLVRDHAGLALLYLMPVALVCLMAYLQNDTFKTILENKMPLVVEGVSASVHAGSALLENVRILLELRLARQ